MKNRIGFISNSSSSSFIIRKENLTELQLIAIRDHISVATKMVKNGLIKESELDYCDECGAWDIKETDDKIIMYTDMDNFNMKGFLELINVEEEHIELGDY